MLVCDFNLSEIKTGDVLISRTQETCGNLPAAMHTHAHTHTGIAACILQHIHTYQGEENA